MSDHASDHTNDRTATITRHTNETRITLTLNLDGRGEADIYTGVGFFDHMLHHVAHHGLIDLTIQAAGDLHIDAHHTIEDVAICLGRALDEALGDRKGITRMGSAYVPMDEALARVVVDLSGRPYAVIQADFAAPMMGQMPTSLVAHVLESIAFNARMNLHAAVLYGRDDHHKAEALFKALGRALNAAVTCEPRRGGVPSTKGTLTG
ncbi:MAG: imidazoleglycerol-phosphate dehydratase HisB [Anaerolineae bacterium]|nr:imidazoleglycerol-phosphate dehydratase HisB [Anaerolineae bacterium]